MTTPSLPAPPAAVETIDPVTRTCAASWDSLAGIGDLLASGRLADAWTTAASAAGTCWDSLGALVTSTLPFLA